MPSTANRIKAILKRAKVAEVLARFTAAYNRHFLLYLRPPVPREPTNDEKLTWLQSDVPRLNVTLKSLDRSLSGQFTYSFEFCCHDCGGYVIDAPDNDDEDGPALCKACGQVFGKFGQVKALAKHIGQTELSRRGLA